MSNDEQCVVFPAEGAGRRSSTALGRAVVADALRPVDPAGARAAAAESSWRSGYLPHFRRLVEAGLEDAPSALAIARSGLGSLHRRMEVAAPEETAVGGGSPPGRSLADWTADERRLGTFSVTGEAPAVHELVLPYRGERLRGAALLRRIDAWAASGVVEPTLVEAVHTVVAHPDWLRLEGRTVAVLGAAAEMGPLPALLRWGARVAAVDLPRPEIWERLLRTANGGAGTLVVPTADATLATAGVDLLCEAPLLERWLAEQPGELVVGTYVYADGATHARVAMAADEIARRLLAARDDVALAYLATPTDAFVVPGDAVAASTRAYDERSRTARALARPLRTVSGGRLLRRNYVPDADPGIADALAAQQGPGYALAKRLQRWRATVARHDGVTVSLNVAPPTRTRSVVKNRALAAAYAGAHRFGVEVFDPSTANVLMAALLVHDLHTGGGPRHAHPWQDEAYAAAHGGLWRAAYAPRSALGLAALLGYGASRG